MKLMLDIKVGDRIKVTRYIGLSTDLDGESGSRQEEVRVIGLYPDHTLVKNRWGTRWSVANAELFQKWYRKTYGETRADGPKFYANKKAA